MKIASFLSCCLFTVPRLTLANVQVADNVKQRLKNSQLLDSYDFVIAGGGTSGLTVADRLTEAFPGSLWRFLLIALHRIKARDVS